VLSSLLDARELWRFLESKQDFSTWIKKRITDFGFLAGADYLCFHKNMKANNATLVEYYLKLDMAKELSMLERNAKGKEARLWFIAREKQASMYENMSKRDWMQAAIDAEDRRLLLEQNLKETEPAVEFVKHVTTRSESTLPTIKEANQVYGIYVLLPFFGSSRTKK
jgi:anti-repressor protein